MNAIGIALVWCMVQVTLVGLLAAGIMSAVMGSDCHQILGLSTMFTKDLVGYYGQGGRISEQQTVMLGRVFIVVLNGLAYLVALGKPRKMQQAAPRPAAPSLMARLGWWSSCAGQRACH